MAVIGFSKHGDGCNCPHCINLLITKRIDALEERLFSTSKANEAVEKSAFQEFLKKEGIPKNSIFEMCAKKSRNATIDEILNMKELHPFLSQAVYDAIIKRKEP